MSDRRAEETVLQPLKSGETQEFRVGERLPNVIFPASIREAVMNAVVPQLPKTEGMQSRQEGNRADQPIEPPA
jgi:hypothetical protein